MDEKVYRIIHWGQHQDGTWVHPRFGGKRCRITMDRHDGGAVMVSVEGEVGADQVNVPLAWLEVVEW